MNAVVMNKLGKCRKSGLGCDKVLEIKPIIMMVDVVVAVVVEICNTSLQL